MGKIGCEVAGDYLDWAKGRLELDWNGRSGKFLGKELRQDRPDATPGATLGWSDLF